MSNQIILKYKGLDSDGHFLRIFSDKFVNNNKKNCKLIINGQEKPLHTHYDGEVKAKEIEIKLIINEEDITDISFMFDNCTQLVSFINNPKLNTSNIKNMEYIFKNCSRLSCLTGLSYWNTSNVINMKGMFYGCYTLSSLPDI